MKKLYTLALAAAVALSASAFDAKVIRSFNKVQAESTNLEILNKKRTPMKAVAAENVLGRYVWDYYQPLGENGAELSGERFELFAIEGEDTMVGIKGIANGFDVAAAIDYAAGTLTLVSYNMGEVTLGDGTTCNAQFVVGDVNLEDAGFNATETPLVATFSGDKIVMAEDKGFGIVAVDPATSTVLGWFNLCYLNVFTKYDESKYWTNVGDGTFVDGIMFTPFGDENQTTPPTSTVQVQRSVATPTTFRIKNAWNATFGWEAADDDPTLEFDLADPTFVTVPFQTAGVNVQGRGETFIVSFTAAVKSKEEFEADPEIKDLTIVLEDNVVKFAPNSVGFNWPYATASGVNPNSLYTFKVAYPSTLTLPEGYDGVDEIVTENNGPVEYFNLQGVRVANPENGLYIRRQGNKATKVLVK